MKSRKGSPGILSEVAEICGRRSELSEPAQVLLSSVQGMNVSEYTEHELLDLEKSCAAIMAACRLETMRRDGFRMAPWQGAHGGAPFNWRRAGFDAGYRVVNAKSGACSWFAETRELGERELSELQRLARHGWIVRIDAMLGTVAPGRMVLVVLEKE